MGNSFDKENSRRDSLPRQQSTAESGYNYEDFANDDDMLTLTHLQSAIQLLTTPSNEDIHDALMSLVVKHRNRWPALDKFKHHKDFISIYPNYDYLADIQDSLSDLGDKAAFEVLTLIGEELIDVCCHGITERSLKCLGETFQDFLSSLDGVYDVLKLQEDDLTDTDFICANAGELIFTTDRPAVAYLLLGVLKNISRKIYKVDPIVSIELIDGDLQRYRYQFKTEATLQESMSNKENSNDPNDLQMTNESFCKAFPWHFILDENLNLVQMGSAFSKLFRGMSDDDLSVNRFFKFKRPQGLPLKFKEIVRRRNTPFLLMPRPSSDRADFNAKNLEIKGQMVYCPESNSLLFLGSPFLDGLDGLTNNGLYISDIPLHDATREVILVGEQARAQDGLRRRMDKLKTSIEEANDAVNKERKKNVSLLQLMFPSEIAEKLWKGQKIDAQPHPNVTMLFSDIVGFTSICSTATPFQVISMLESLYKDFDEFCGFFDVYKVETIGDAYCVASGLHRVSIYDAHKVAWMSLSMIRACSKHLTHAGKQIEMRIGLHTGTVLAGIVGQKMPRYCLFGHNVTIANKFESGSEKCRVNISPTTKFWLTKHRGFDFELTPRDPSCLPKEYSKTKDETCYFLDGYRHPTIPNSEPLEKHIEAAMEVISLSD